MKLEKDRNVIEQNGLTDSGEFTIESNAHAFQILSSGVYTNKLRAPIRELCCNAFDAHTANGNPETPIEIKLPTSRNTTFSVRDFGPGLTKEDVETIYTTYFKSTRNTSNEYTGGFGIGSKSPFAVVKSFEIESRVGETATTYEAFLDKDGMPHIRVIKEVATNDPSGLTISMKVPKEEVNAFIDQAADVFRAFSSPYKLANAPGSFQTEEPWLNLTGETIGKTLWRQAGHEYEDWGRGRIRGTDQKVVMGNICYPLATFANKIEEGKDLLIDWFMRQSLVIDVPVGTLSVAASREDLSYDKKTLQALPKLIHEEVALFAQYIYEQAKQESTKYACAQKLSKICETYGVSTTKTELLESIAKAGGWPDDILSVVKGGLSAILPKGVEIARVNPLLAETEMIFAKMNSRRGKPYGGRQPSRSQQNDVGTITNIDELVDHFERTTRKGGISNLHGGRETMHFIQGMLELGLSPHMLSMLTKPLVPYKGQQYTRYLESDIENEVIAIPSYRLKSLVDNEKSNSSRGSFGGFFEGSVQNVDREALKMVISALNKQKTTDTKTRGRPARYDSERNVVALFPDETISPKTFGDLISQVNNEWGTTFDVGNQELSAEIPVIEDAAVENVEPKILGYEIWEGHSSNVDPRQMYERMHHGEQVDLLKDDKPYLYIEEHRRVNLGSCHREAVTLFSELGAPPRLIVLSSDALKELAAAGKSVGRSFEDFIKNDVLPWAVMRGMTYDGRNNHHYMMGDIMRTLVRKLAAHPEGAGLSVVKNLDTSMPQAADPRVERLVRQLLDRYDLRLPKAVDPFAELANTYPFLGMRSVYESKDLSPVIDYIRAVDAKRSLDNALSNGPQV